MKLGIVQIINERVPSQMDEDPGTVFLGMILDTLSGMSPLYRKQRVPCGRGERRRDAEI